MTKQALSLRYILIFIAAPQVMSAAVALGLFYPIRVQFQIPPDFSFTFRESSLLQQQPVLQFTDKFSGDGFYIITLCLLKWTSNSGEDPYPGEPEPPLFSQYLVLSGVTRDEHTQTE